MGAIVTFTIVDTDILIDLDRGERDAIACVQRLEHHAALAISAVTQMELIVGCRNRTESHDLEISLRRFQILKITDQISDRAVPLLARYSRTCPCSIAVQ